MVSTFKILEAKATTTRLTRKVNILGYSIEFKNKIKDPFSPCSCHRLDLVATDAAKFSVPKVTLFGEIQRL
jgi:hypothetical protein